MASANFLACLVNQQVVRKSMQHSPTHLLQLEHTYVIQRQCNLFELALQCVRV